MDLVGYVLMPIQKNGRSYLFNIPMGAPFEDLTEVITEIQANVVILEENDKKAKEKAAAESTSTDSDTPQS